MPLPREDVEATTPKFLRDKYAIVGVGETTYTRGSGMTTRALGTWAVRNAIVDAGLKACRRRRHAVLSVERLDVLAIHRRRPRHPPQFLHGRVRRRLLDRGADRHRHRRDRGRHVQDGGDLPRHERLLPGAHRRHRRARRGAGLGRHAAQPRLWLAERGTDVRPTFMRHMYDYGTTAEQVAAVRVAHSEHASNNPKAYYKKRVTVEDVRQQPHRSASRCICSTAAWRPTTPLPSS